MSVHTIVFQLVFVVLVTLFAYLNARKVLYIADDGIVIKGIFKKIHITASELKGVRIRKNFICRVLDWHLVEIEKAEGNLRVYTREINRERIASLLSRPKI